MLSDAQCAAYDRDGVIVVPRALAPVIAGPATPIGHLLAPLPSLAVELFQSDEAAACPEGIAHEADGAFDAAFLLGSADLTGARYTVIVGT